MPVAVVQPTVVYGPFSLPWTIGPLGALKSSRVVLANGGDGMCNAVYVDDVVAALLLAASRPEAVGQVFLISAESPITWKDFYAAYEDMLGFRSTVGLTAEEFRALRRSQARVRSASPPAGCSDRMSSSTSAKLSLRSVLRMSC